jgi:hypothetical protein
MSTTTRATPLTFGRARLHAPEPPFVYERPPDEARRNAARLRDLVYDAVALGGRPDGGFGFFEFCRAVDDAFGGPIGGLDDGWAYGVLCRLPYVRLGRDGYWRTTEGRRPG